MKTSELVTWVQQWFDPALDVPRAAALWGKVGGGEDPLTPAVDPKDAARFERVAFELLGEPAGFLSGVLAILRTPEPIRWDQVKAQYGEPRFAGVAWDEWSGLRDHTFKLEHGGMRGYLLLAVRGDDPQLVHVQHLAIRRFPPGGLAPAAG